MIYIGILFSKQWFPLPGARGALPGTGRWSPAVPGSADEP
jgi:hypothetical protein